MKAEEINDQLITSNTILNQKMELSNVSDRSTHNSINYKTIQMKFRNTDTDICSDALVNNNQWQPMDGAEDKEEEGEEDEKSRNKDDASLQNAIRQKHIVFENKGVLMKNKKRTNANPIPVPIPRINQHEIQLNRPIYCKKKTLDQPRQLTPQITKRHEHINHKDVIKYHEETRSTITHKTINPEFILNNTHTAKFNDACINTDDNVEAIKAVDNDNSNSDENKIGSIEFIDACVMTTEDNTTSKCLFTENNLSNESNSRVNNSNNEDIFNEHIKNLVHIQEQYEKLNLNYYKEKRKEKELIKKNEILKNNLKKIQLKLQKQTKLNLNKKLNAKINKMRQYKKRSSTIIQNNCTNNTFNENKSKEWEKKTPINIFNIISNPNHPQEQLKELNAQKNNNSNSNSNKSNNVKRTEQFLNEINNTQKEINQNQQSKALMDPALILRDQSQKQFPIYDDNIIQMQKAKEESVRRYSSNIEEQSRALSNSRNIINKIEYPIYSSTTIDQELSRNKGYDNKRFGFLDNYSNINIANHANPNHHLQNSNNDLNGNQRRHPNDFIQLTSPDLDYKFKFFHFNSPHSRDPINHRYSYIKQDAEYSLNTQLDKKYNYSSTHHYTSEDYSLVHCNEFQFNRNDKQLDRLNTDYKYNQTYYNTYNNYAQGILFSSREREIKEQKKELYAKAFGKVDYSRIYKNKSTYPIKSNVIKDSMKNRIAKI